MDPEHPEVMEPKPEEIRHQIEETRSALTEKLETLENEVVGTVHNVTESVEQTFENVKETVHETVQTVKRTFDLEYQVDQHPWAMLGGSVLAGCLAGTLFESSRHGRRGSWAPAAESLNTLASAPSYAQPSPSYEPSGSAKESWLQSFLHQFDHEIEEAKGLAIGAALGLLRDYIKQSLPSSIEPKVEEILDSVTAKLGGRPVAGPVMEVAQPEQHPGYSRASW
jgi:hypothetical protein